jgi:hypothetical protein
VTEEFTPETEPSGSLDPPRRPPPTAVGAMTPEPEPDPRRYEGERSVPNLEEPLRPVTRVMRNLVQEIERLLERL